MKNATELRAKLAAVFESLNAGEIDHKVASELANLAGKMISSAKVQVEYYTLCGQSPVIEWLSDDSETRAQK